MNLRVKEAIVMEIQINYPWTDEEKAIIREGITKLVDSVRPSLQLDSLKLILIPHDFGVELIDFQKKNGMRTGYTDNGLGLAVAKVLNYVENELLVCNIIINPAIVLSMFNEETSSEAVHIFHHELCHVHDESLKFDLFHVAEMEELFAGENSTVRQISYSHSDTIWSEYIATRLSSTSKPSDHHMYVESFLEAIPETLNRCKKAKEDYQEHLDVGKLFREVQGHISYLLKTYAYFLGYFHSMNESFSEEHYKRILEFSPYLEGVIDAIPLELQKLYTSYGSWDDHVVFQNLANIVLISWGKVGIHPSDVSDGRLYIGVTYDV